MVVSVKIFVNYKTEVTYLPYRLEYYVVTTISSLCVTITSTYGLGFFSAESGDFMCSTNGIFYKLHVCWVQTLEKILMSSHSVYYVACGKLARMDDYRYCIQVANEIG